MTLAPSLRTLGLAAGVWLAAPGALAETPSALNGDYVCQYGCRVTDANPSVEIRGDEALCMNELGGLFRGQQISPRSLSCFHMIGRLSPDGSTLVWDNGEIWKRHVPGPN